MRVVVVGAGAFGGWTALELVRRGADVTLVEAWGPGHARASSGGETRVIRAGYGTRRLYTAMAVRAMARWQAHDARFGHRFLHRTGALWMFGSDDGFGRASAAALHDAGQRMDELGAGDAARRYPQINFDGIRSVFVEPDAGVLLARRACEHVAECVVAEGGRYLCAAARAPLRIEHPLRRLALLDGPLLDADAFVFACGPWLGALFPDLLADRVVSTRQDVFYFGTPAGDARYLEDGLPVWLELGDRLVYGIPGNAHRGFKMADDAPGPAFDPTSGERIVGAETTAAARAYLARRFPAMAAAPLVGTEVCQYESTPDAHYLLDRHPAAPNVWIAGGGSGHGFKMGPVIGEMLADAVLGIAAPDPTFGLARLTAGSAQPRKWE